MGASSDPTAMKRNNICGAKWPRHLQCLQHRGRQGRDDKGVRRFAGPEAEDIRQGKAEPTWRGLETWHGRDSGTLADERARQQGTQTST